MKRELAKTWSSRWAEARVPGAHAGEQGGHGALADPAGGRAILVIMIPEIAHRRVAIADVRRVRRRQHAFGGPGLAADHEVVAVQIELLEREGHEREVGLVVAIGAGQLLDEGGAYIGGADRRRNRLGHIDMREDIGLREQPQQLLQHALPAPHRHQPVMDDRHARRTAPIVRHRHRVIQHDNSLYRICRRRPRPGASSGFEASC